MGVFPVCVQFSDTLAYVLTVTYIDPKLNVLLKDSPDRVCVPKQKPAISWI